MKVIKWNVKKRDYELYQIPKDWNICSYTDDMDKQINCCQCGKIVRFGDCYTSLEVHTPVGFGFAVCSECYDKEWARKKEVENENHN